MTSWYAGASPTTCCDGWNTPQGNTGIRGTVILIQSITRTGTIRVTVPLIPARQEITQNGRSQGVKMKQISRKVWISIGWVSLLLTAWSFVLATVDGVMALFMFPVAMLVGGISGLGATSTARFGIATIFLCTALVFGMTHYVASAGFQTPNGSTASQAIALIAIPLAVSSGMLIWGANARRKKENCGDSDLNSIDHEDGSY